MQPLKSSVKERGIIGSFTSQEDVLSAYGEKCDEMYSFSSPSAPSELSPSSPVIFSSKLSELIFNAII